MSKARQIIEATQLAEQEILNAVSSQISNILKTLTDDTGLVICGVSFEVFESTTIDSISPEFRIKGCAIDTNLPHRISMG